MTPSLFLLILEQKLSAASHVTSVVNKISGSIDMTILELSDPLN